MNELSQRLSLIKPSATLAVNAKATKLRAQGHHIINLSVGEPDFDTPEFIKKAAIAAIREGFTKYTPTDGIPELREAIVAKLENDNNLHYKKEQILVSDGLKQTLFNLAQALLNEGDEVIIPSPYWVSYPAMVKLAGATPVFVESTMANRFKMQPEHLAKAITPKTRLLILNSPSNPSGMAYSEDELKALGAVLEKHPNVLIASDDIYEYILWGMSHYVNILNACPELKDRTIVGNGVSKAYAMTGWRIGYAAGPEYIISAMKKIQSQSTTCANSIAQKAAAAALTAKHDFFYPMLEAYKTRHDLVHHALNQMDGVECLASDGTFYLFPNMTGAIKTLGVKDDLELAEYLLEKAKVAVIPGTAFGMPNFIRLSCATSEENLRKAIEQIEKSIKARALTLCQHPITIGTHCSWVADLLSTVII